MAVRNNFVSRGRSFSFLVIFLLFYLLIVGRSFQLQVADHERWAKKAQGQQMTTVSVPAQRGTIFDRNANPLALSSEVDSIYINPRVLTAPDLQAERLAEALKLSKKKLKKSLLSDRHFVWVKRHVSPSESKRVQEMEVPGIGIVKEYRRFYPNSTTAAHLLGFTGTDPVGLEGVEQRFDDYLKGDDTRLLAGRDGGGKRLLAGENFVGSSYRGDDLYLTIDRNLQFVAERELAKEVEATGAKSGSVVVIDPKTGAIMAMANVPTFNPNNYRSTPRANWRNRAALDMFEPGSTFKPFIVAAAINEGLVTGKTRINCENGSYRVADKVIHEASRKRYKRLTVEEIIKYSSNIGCVKLGQMLKRETLARYLQAFGFGQKSGIELSGESSGILRNASSWYELDLAAISFGQGVSVTAVQMAAATAALVNGGKLMQPYLVERVVKSNGSIVKKREPQTVRQAISSTTAEMVRSILLSTTSDGGTATRARVDGFDVGGKTGTAQKPDRVNGGYDAEKRIVSFVGFAPAKDPTMVAMIVLDEPQERAFGGLSAAPLFSRITSQALRQFDLDGKSELPDQLVAENSETTPISTEQGQMPDMTGLSFREVLQNMEKSGLNIQIQGSGRVVTQYPQANQSIPDDATVWVKLMPVTK